MTSTFNARAAHRELVTRILEGPAMAAAELRRAAFDNRGLTPPLGALVDKVAVQPTRVTDGDMEAAQASGLTEDQVFELVICAAVGQASREYESALKALDRARAGGGTPHAP